MTSPPKKHPPLKVMLIDEDRGRAALLQQALRDADYQVVAITDTCENILQRVQETPVDVIIIDMASPNRDTLEYVASLNRQQPKAIVMFAQESNREAIQTAIKAGVSAYVVDGLNLSRLKPILEVAVARFREYQAMRQELESVRTQLEERKIIEKAKGILMRQKGIDEETAYHTLRKLAMERNQRLAEIAENFVAISKILS